jgi:hypothetical protein
MEQGAWVDSQSTTHVTQDRDLYLEDSVNTAQSTKRPLGKTFSLVADKHALLTRNCCHQVTANHAHHTNKVEDSIA